MARAAINVLDADEDGFVLLVEGGAIDSAGHDNQKGRMIEEVTAFDEMVTAVLAWVENNSSWEESLVIVTADHETGYLTAGEGVSMAEPLKSQGYNRLPQMHFNATHHTNHLVPFFAQGKGSARFSAAATKNDAVRGWYMDNTDMAKVLFDLLEADHENRNEREQQPQSMFDRY
jgi:alkaline phosphatase